MDQEKVAFLEGKIRELDQVIRELETSEEVGCGGEYAEQLRELEERRRTRLQAAEKRRQFQTASLLSQFDAQRHSLDTGRVPEGLQEAFGRRRQLIEVDKYVEGLRQRTPPTETPAPGCNWLETDLKMLQQA